MQDETPGKKKKPSLRKRILRSTLLCIVLIIGVTFLFVMFFENRMIFLPSGEGQWDLVDRSPVPTSDVFLTASDGVRIHGWLMEGADARRTILYLHGNAGNVTHRYEPMINLARLPANVFCLDYRGYGKSEGSPDEAGIYRDAEAAWKWLTEEKGFTPENIVIYGKSLGGAPACELASRHPCGGLVLNSTFTNARAMARRMMPLIPAWLFLRTKFDNIGKISKYTGPLLVIQSRADEMIPYEMGVALHEAAPGPKTMVSFEEAGHNTWLPEEIREAFREFFAGLD